MADPRTFTLIGEFKDGITPELERINRQLATLKASLSGVGSRKNTRFRGATNDIGKLVSAHKNLTSSIKEVDGALRSTLGTLKQYRSEMGKAASATRAFQKAGGNLGGGQFKKDMDAANKSAQAYLRTLQQINSQSRRMPSGGMGGGFQPPRPPRGGGGGGGMRPPTSTRGGGAGAGPGGFHMAEFGFAYTLGNALSQPIQNAIVQGFQIGVGLMTKPFEYFANRLGERIQDEMSDLKAAGGFFSMAKRQQEPFVKNFAEAIQFTQENNKVMARLAASLPGKTQDYIEVAKRISDSVARTVLQDRAGTIKMAEQIRAGDIRTYGAKSITEMTGSEQTKKTIQVLLGDLTKDTVLAGMGGRAGAGGAMGAYGLPQLSERMISQDEVSMGQMQRYSAIFSDPMIMDALQRNINKINATSKNSADRLKAIAAMYKEIVTPELVERYRRTLAGVAETFNTAIFGEETGLFGLGRKMEGLGIKFNEYGQMLDKTGKVTTDLTQAAREDLAIYDLFRDILVNVGQVLAPIVENFSMIYDPLKQLGIDLNKAREVTYRVLQSFNQYRKGFENFGKQFKGIDKEKFDATRDLRAALLTIGNVMADFKVIGESDFTSLLNKLKDPNANIAQILKNLVDQFMTSDVAAKIGEFVGTIVGTVLSEVAKITGLLSGRIASSNKLFEGLKKGFTDAGGLKAIKSIFEDVFKSLFRILLKIMAIIPLEGYMLMGAMVVVPAAAQALGMAIGSGIAGFVGKLGKGLLPLLQKTSAPAIKQMRDAIQSFFMRLADFFRARFAKDLSIQQVTVRDLTGQPALPPAKGSEIVKQGGAIPGGGALAKATPGMTAFGKFMNYIKGVGPRFMGFFKGFLGKFAIFGGVLTSLISLFQGKDLATSLAEGAGPVLGAALGAALIPFLGPIGPMIGSAIGGWIGSLKSVTEPLADSLRATFGAVQSAFDLVIQIGRDVVGVFNGLIRLIPGVSQGFDLLRFAMFALLSPFKMLEIAINGLYDLYLWIKSKTVGVSPEERARMNERRTQRATDEFTIQGREAAGYTLAQQKSEEYQKFLTAKIEGNTEKMNRSAEYMKSIVRMMEQRGIKPTATAGAPASGPTAAQLAETFKIGKPAPPVKTPAPTATQLAETFNIGKPKPKAAAPSSLSQLLATAPKVKTPTTPAAPAKAVQTTATLTNQINQKATTQVKETTAVKASTDRTTQAVNNLTSKMTAQSSLQQTVANIYSLLASGATRVMATLSNLPPGFSGNGVLPPGVRPNLDPSKGSVQFPGIGNTPGLPRYKGNLGDAISTEMKNKPAGSKLVVANSSETIIPKSGIISAATGHIPKFSKMVGALAKNQGPSSPIKYDEGMGGYVPNPGAGRPTNVRYKGLPQAYMSPNGMYQQGGSSTAAAPISVTSPITINTQPGQNADEIASIVAMKIGDAVAQARASSVFV
jgi:hypothetical protein